MGRVPLSKKAQAHHRMVVCDTSEVPELTFRSAVLADTDSLLLSWEEAEAVEDSNRPTERAKPSIDRSIATPTRSSW